jgi:TatD DNase family protein
MHYIDAHTHLNSDELYGDRQKHLTDFIAVWWVWLINVWVDPVRNTRGVDIAQLALGFYWDKCCVKATVGWHPSEVSFGHVADVLAVALYRNELEKLIRTHRSHIVAVGECGIDAHYPWFTQETVILQQLFFREQCELARKYALPIVVHSRDAFDLTVEVLEEFPDLKIYFHCRWYGPQEAKKLLTLFPYLRFGFCGNVTYPKAVALRESFLYLIDNEMYLEKKVGILVETDAPWLAPQWRRGQRHAPMFISEQYAFLAQLAQLTEEDFSSRVLVDSKRLYGILDLC